MLAEEFLPVFDVADSVATIVEAEPERRGRPTDADLAREDGASRSSVSWGGTRVLPVSGRLSLLRAAREKAPPKQGFL
jgi:hypothetical protein